MIKELFKGKLIIIGLILSFMTGGALYAFLLPNIYKSEVLLAPNSNGNQGGVSGLSSQLGGLASLAGVNIGSAENQKTTLAINIMKSRTFTIEFLNSYDYKAVITSVESWHAKDNQLIFIDDVYDDVSKNWLLDIETGKSKEPTDLEMYESFHDSNFALNEDKESGLISLSISHKSPYVAKTIATEFVSAINSKVREMDIVETTENLTYLQEQLKGIENKELQEVLYELIEQQMQKKMLASSSASYVFKTIDPAYLPEKKSSPKRFLIIFVASMFGAAIGFAIVVLRL
ncbi:Wzz/FepE/Etk N-terminal domain-containing protein [Glaciecola sp. MF2-115]|uniref:Wzz/FepE/Etk N-terminal domain-containing protein n=1 Tax=Glaciecola sp. MF2-115 TaxID=3384827 RepID=UPI0039A3AA86